MINELLAMTAFNVSMVLVICLIKLLMDYNEKKEISIVLEKDKKKN
jgi:hypothetical protein